MYLRSYTISNGAYSTVCAIRFDLVVELLDVYKESAYYLIQIPM